MMFTQPYRNDNYFDIRTRRRLSEMKLSSEMMVNKKSKTWNVPAFNQYAVEILIFDLNEKLSSDRANYGITGKNTIKCNLHL